MQRYVSRELSYTPSHELLGPITEHEDFGVSPFIFEFPDIDEDLDSIVHDLTHH